MKSFKNRMGMDSVLICSKSASGYRWRSIDGKNISKYIAANMTRDISHISELT